jgi:hypothetical protein
MDIPLLPFSFELIFAGYSFRVEIFKGEYNGQNPTKLVTKKIKASIPRMMATTPEITPVRYRIRTKIANATLTIRSTVPIFFFILFLHL